jgi:hypothetical protein
MCDGTAECSADGSVKAPKTTGQKPDLSNLSRDDIESIITETVKRIKDGS